MLNSHKIFFAQFLILIMTISSFQGALAAIDFDQSAAHEETHQVMQLSLLDESGVAADSNYPTDHSEDNQTHSHCGVQCYVSFLQAPYEAFLFTRSISQKKITVDSSAFTSHLSGLPKRPPKI